jgi:hypothetical protein
MKTKYPREKHPIFRVTNEDINVHLRQILEDFIAQMYAKIADASDFQCLFQTIKLFEEMFDKIILKAIEKYNQIYAYKQLDDDREWTSAEQKRLEMAVRLTKAVQPKDKWDRISEIIETRKIEEIKKFCSSKK